MFAAPLTILYILTAIDVTVADVADVIEKSVNHAAMSVDAVQASASAAASAVDTIGEAVGLLSLKQEEEEEEEEEECTNTVVVNGFSYKYNGTKIPSDKIIDGCYSGCVYEGADRKVCFTSMMEAKDLADLPSKPPAKGLFIVGSIGNGWYVELWSRQTLQSCKFPSIKYGYNRDEYTVDSVQGQVVFCYMYSCLKLGKPEWSHLQNTLQPRLGHTSTVIGTRILLAGGYLFPTTTELMPVDGRRSIASFRLQPGRMGHCAIKVSDTTVILTGGVRTESLVTEHTFLENGKVTTSDLTSLTEGRAFHACGLYENNGGKKLLVTGGKTKNVLEYDQYLSTTFIYDYSPGAQGTWSMAYPLPSARAGLRAATVAGVLYVSGGISYKGGALDEILEWNNMTTKWNRKSYRMKFGQGFHSVTEVTLDSVTEFCT